MLKEHKEWKGNLRTAGFTTELQKVKGVRYVWKVCVRVRQASVKT